MTNIDQPDDELPTTDWMKRRQEQINNEPADYARGLDAVSAAIRNGQDVDASTPAAIRALGADMLGQDAAEKAAQAIRRGNKAILSDPDYAGILFNETRSFSGPNVQKAREHLAHALMNADETWGTDRAKYAKSAPAVAKPPKVEMPAYQSALAAVAAARAERAKGNDPTNGALNFRFTTTPTRDQFYGRSVSTQVALHNGYTKGDVPSETAYVNTYR